MTSKGAIYTYSYEIDGVESSISPRNVPKGKTVTLKLEVYNGGTTSGLVVGKITHNDNMCRYGYKKDCGVGVSNRLDIECSFVMGAIDERVDYYAYHAYQGSADAHRVIELKAGAAPPAGTCTQSVLVRKKHTSNINLKGVSVEARPSSGNVVRGVTGSDGRCYLNLTKTKVYDILISPSSGYTCEHDHDCEKRGVTACISEIEFFLSEKGIGACDQDVKVTLKDNSGERVALDWGDGETVHGKSGTIFRHRYTEGKWVTIKATASGYEPASKYLYVCSSTIYFELRKLGTPSAGQVKVTATSAIPLWYTDDTDVYAVPVTKGAQFDLGIAICDGRYEKNDCWERYPGKCVIYSSQITSYAGVVEKAIDVNGYRGRVRIDFTKDPIEMHVTITSYPTVAAPAAPVQEPPPATGEKWNRNAFKVVWDGNNIIINYEMENANPTVRSGVPGECRYTYYTVARAGTKTAEGSWMNSSCAAKQYTGSVRVFWSVTPGMNIPVDLGMFDRQLETRKIVDTFMVTVPEKEAVGNKITVTVGASFDISKSNTIKCGEVVPFPLPGRSTWIPKPIGYDICKKSIPANRIVEFTAVDGLVEGHHYVFTIYPITWLDQVMNGHVFEFRGTKTWTIQNITLIHKPICELLGIPPESQQCKDEVGEFIDPIYAYNTVHKIMYHTDMHGAPAEPETLDYVILPLVVAGSFLPIPVGKAGKLLSKMSGGLAKYADTVAKKVWLKTHQKGIHHLTALGDDLNLRTFWDNFKLGKLSTCENILKQADEVAKRAENQAKLLGNEGKWVRGIRAKWKADPTKIKTKIDDLEKGADGNLFKTFSDDISYHFDDAAKAGDWKKAREIYHGAAMSVDDMRYLEHNLAKFSPEFRRMHNIMRYGNDDFIKLLKTEKAAVPEFANRFDEGVDYIIRHIGEETGEEVGAYKAILDAIPESEVSVIVRNLSGAGKSAAAAVTHVLKADATKGVGAFYASAAKGVKGTAKLSKKEQKAVAASLKSKMDDAAKTMTPKETAAVEAALETDDIVKYSKLGRLWKYIHGAPGATKFKDLPLWAKAGAIFGVFLGASEVWKRTMDFCMALFIGEETIQWAGFGGIVLNSLTYDWNEKTLAEKKKLIQIFKDFRAKRQGIHDLVTSGAGLFETLCVVFGQIYRNFWEADAISLWALDQKIADMERGIDPLSGLGVCTLIAQADKKGVAFYVHGETKKYYSGGAFSKVYVSDVIVRDAPYAVVLCAEKEGYCLLMQKIRITGDDLGDTLSTPLFNMVPDTEAGPNPFQGLPYTDEEYNKLATKPEVRRHGKIVCATSPAGAKIYLDGVYKNAQTNWTLEYVPIGNHTVVFKKDGYADCTVNVTVAVEPDAQAYCNLEGAEGSITFKCAHNDKYCERGATIQYRKKGETWETFGKKTSSYAVTKTDLDAGIYEVKYNLLNVMESQGEVTVKAGETVDFDKQMSSLLPESIRTTVTAIIDGDSIRTAYTDDSRFPPPSSMVEHQELRLIGYDSEECEHYPEVCAPGGEEAGDFLKKLLPIGTEIELRIFRWLPLGAHNRIIAGVFKDGEDIAKKMLSSCLVKLVDSKYYDKYPWIKWEGGDSYESAWCEPYKTNVTISTSDAYGASMNVDVIMFDNEMKGSAEGGVTIKNVRAGKHTIEIRDDILEDRTLWAYVQPLNQAFKAPCIFEIDVRAGETYRVRVRLGVKAGEPVDNARGITFSVAPSSARIHVDERVYMQKAGEVTKIPMTIGKSQAIEFQASGYAPLTVELMATSDMIKCTTTDVCGYKTSRPYVLVTKDYVRAFLKLLATTAVAAGSFEEWKAKKGGGGGIGSDEVLSISQAYKGKKEIGFMPSLDDIIDTVSEYMDRKP